jgi:hypothetical protein
MRPTFVALAAAGVALWVVWRQSAPASVAVVAEGGAVAETLVDVLRKWLSRQGPYPGAPAGHGNVQPATSMDGRYHRYAGAPVIWAAPTAGRGPRQKSSAPGARVLLPGPFPPGSAVPQSATHPESPFLPQDLELAAPLAANRWYFGLSAADPTIAAAAGSGGMIDVQRVDLGRILREA